jgi:hypothetical protein
VVEVDRPNRQDRWNAHADRIRNHPLQPTRRTADSSELTPPNPG